MHGVTLLFIPERMVKEGYLIITDQKKLVKGGNK